MYRHNKIKTSLAGVVLSVATVTGIAVLGGPTDAQVPPAATPSNSTLQQRIEQRKAERGIVPESAEEKRLPSVCTTAQAKARPLQQSAITAADKRIKINDLVDARLWIMVGKLKMAGVDSYALESAQTELRAKTTASEQTTTDYRQALDDLTAVDCKADPVGFKAMLETARIYHTQLRDQLADQRSYTNDEVKTVLNDYATDLQGRSTPEEEQQEEEEGAN